MGVIDDTMSMLEESSEHDEFDECSCECRCLQDWDCDCDDEDSCDCDPTITCFCVREGCACTFDEEVVISF